MDQIKMSTSLPGGNDVFEAMVSQKMDEFDLSNVFVGVLQRSSARSEEYIPDLVREIFKFLDLDDSGTIFSAEIKLLKALLDALLNLGQRAVQDLSSGEAKPTEGSNEDHAIALATTIPCCSLASGSLAHWSLRCSSASGGAAHCSLRCSSASGGTAHWPPGGSVPVIP